MSNIDNEEKFAQMQADEDKEESKVEIVNRVTEKVRIEIDKDLNRTKTTDRVNT